MHDMRVIRPHARSFEWHSWNVQNLWNAWNPKNAWNVQCAWYECSAGHMPAGGDLTDWHARNLCNFTNNTSNRSRALLHRPTSSVKAL